MKVDSEGNAEQTDRQANCDERLDREATHIDGPHGGGHEEKGCGEDRSSAMLLLAARLLGVTQAASPSTVTQLA